MTRFMHTLIGPRVSDEEIREALARIRAGAATLAAAPAAAAV